MNARYTLFNSTGNNCRIIILLILFCILDHVSPVLGQSMTLEVISPNGEEIWQVGESRYIEWRATDNIADVIIEISYNSGITWKPIATVSAANELYHWYVSLPSSAQCLIRITSVQDPDTSDMSDQVFTIQHAPVEQPEPETAHWTLDEILGTTAWDSAVNCRNGQVHDGTWHPSEGSWGGALELHGDGSQVYVPLNGAEHYEFTYSLWVKRAEEDPGDGGLICSERWLPGSVSFELRNSCPALRTNSEMWPNDDLIASDNTLVPGFWYHLAARLSVDRLDIYVDGDLAAGWPLIASDVVDYMRGIQDGLGGTLIGALRDDLTDITRSFAGLIDDVRIYSYALTPEEIQQLAVYPGPSIKVVYPNGGEVFQVGEEIAIKYTEEGFSSTPGRRVWLTMDGGCIWHEIVDELSSNLTWQIWPFLPTSHECMVCVTTLSNPTVADTSDEFFTIENPGTVPVGLVAYYRFDETAGFEVADSSGNELHAEVNPQSQYLEPGWTEGKIDGGLNLKGSGSEYTQQYYVHCSHTQEFAINDQITIMTWINMHDWQDTPLDPNDPDYLDYWGVGIITKFDSWGLFIDSGSGDENNWNDFKARFRIGNQTVSQLGESNSANSWCHLCGTYDGQIMKLYINGHLDNNSERTGPLDVNTYSMLIGAIYRADILDHPRISNFFQGIVDEVRIYSEALSESEINQVMYEQPSYNTPMGSNVRVSHPPVEIVFEQVVRPGNTTYFLSPDVPTPDGYQLCAPIIAIGTTAKYIGKIDWFFRYSDTDCDENMLRLLHYEPVSSEWLDVTTSLNIRSKTICGEVTQLGVFALAVKEN